MSGCCFSLAVFHYRKSKLMMRATISLIVTIAIFMATAIGETAADDLNLTVTIITGEHSRDSSSTMTNLTLSNDTLLYEQSYDGAHSGRRGPVKKQYKLANADKTELMALLNKKDLWVTKTISKPPQARGTSFYFELEMRANSKGKQSLVSIEGSRSDSDLQEDATYRSVVSVIDVIYRVIRRKDPDIARPELIR
jgi:hypothetical protein